MPKFSQPLKTTSTSVIQNLRHNSIADSQWTKNEDSELSPWEAIDLDWMSKTEDEEVDAAYQMVKSTTEPTKYQTKVYKQSITLLIRLKTNESDVSASGLLETALEVGPWKVSRDSLPVLVGSLAGCCLLLLLAVSLALYICLHKKQRTKTYSVKSEGSSVLSNRSPKSGLSSSRDSLVLVTGSSSGHQARLLSDPSTTNHLLFDYSFDFYFDPHNESLKNGSIASSEPSAVIPSTNIGFHQPVDQNGKLLQEKPPSISASIETNVQIERLTPTKLSTDIKPSASNVPTLPLTIRNGLGPNVVASNGGTNHLTRLSSRNSCINTVEEDSKSCLTVSDESLRTRSLPAWVRTKKRPLAYHTDLSSSLYDKKGGHCTMNRQRNRMGSDAAQLIALSKSRIRLISPGSVTSVSSSVNQNLCSKETAFEEYISEAVIVYNERTAL